MHSARWARQHRLMQYESERAAAQVDPDICLAESHLSHLIPPNPGKARFNYFALGGTLVVVAAGIAGQPGRQPAATARCFTSA